MFFTPSLDRMNRTPQNSRSNQRPRRPAHFHRAPLTVDALEERVLLSHFRGAAMLPSVSATGLLTLTSTSFWRPTAVAGIDEGGNPVVPGVGSMNDVGTPTIDTSDTRFTKVVQQHTLQLPPGAGLYTISASSCCRVGGIRNAAESTWTMNSTVVWDGSTASTPINFNFSAIQPEVVRGSDYSGNLSAVADAGLALTYDQALNQNINTQPPGFTINPSTGDLAIPAASTSTYLDNSGTNVGADYAFSGNIFARNGAGTLIGQVEFDWLFDAVATASNRAPTVDDAATTVTPGTTVLHTFTGTDPEGAALTWSFVGLLGPGNASPAIAPTFNPATQAFAWDTTGSVLGTWIAQVRAADPGGLTDIGSLTITVNPVAASGFALTIDDPATPSIDVIIADNAPVGTATQKGLTTHPDGSLLTGTVFFSGGVGAFPINVITATSKPLIGGANEAEIALKSISVSFGRGTLVIMVTDTGYQLASQPGSVVFTSPIGGVTRGKVRFIEEIDLANNQFAIGGPTPIVHTTGQQGPFGSGAFSGTKSVTVSVPNTDPFSLVKTVTVVHTRPGATGIGAGGTVRHSDVQRGSLTVSLPVVSDLRRQSWPEEALAGEDQPHDLLGARTQFMAPLEPEVVSHRDAPVLTESVFSRAGRFDGDELNEMIDSLAWEQSLARNPY